MSPLILPGYGMSNAAGTTTTTTTNETSAEAEVSTTNAINNGDAAAGSSSEALFDEDEDVDVDNSGDDSASLFGDDHASLFGEDSQSSEDNAADSSATTAAGEDSQSSQGKSAATNSTTTIAAAANASVFPEAPRNVVAPVAEGAADRTPDDFDEDGIDFSDDGEDDFDAIEDGNGAIPAATPARAASPADALFLGDNIPAPADLFPVAAAEDSTPAPATPERVAPANGAPAKRGRGRPKNTVPPTPKTPKRYRCRYGCTGIVKGGVALRKHMMRVHCVFSSAHQNLVKCGDCERTIDLNIKELGCVKRRGGRKCPERDVTMTDVIWPRDAQEEADMFAYENSGPGAKGASRLVVVHDGDIEDVYREACKYAINNWSPDGAATGRALSKYGLPSPDETPSQQSFVDLTGDDEVVPATPTPAYEGKGKKRAADFSGPEPKRVMRQDSAMVMPQYTGFQAGVIPQAAPVNDGLITGHDAGEMPVLDDFIVPHLPVMDAAAGDEHFDMVFNDFQNEFPNFGLDGAMDFGLSGGDFDGSDALLMGDL